MAVPLPLTDAQIQQASNIASAIADKLEELRQDIVLLQSKLLLGIDLRGNLVLLTSLNDKYQQRKSDLQSLTGQLP